MTRTPPPEPDTELDLDDLVDAVDDEVSTPSARARAATPAPIRSVVTDERVVGGVVDEVVASLEAELSRSLGAAVEPIAMPPAPSLLAHAQPGTLRMPTPGGSLPPVAPPPRASSRQGRDVVLDDDDVVELPSSARISLSMSAPKSVVPKDLEAESGPSVVVAQTPPPPAPWRAPPTSDRELPVRPASDATVVIVQKRPNFAWLIFAASTGALIAMLVMYFFLRPQSRPAGPPPPAPLGAAVGDAAHEAPVPSPEPAPAAAARTDGGVAENVHFGDDDALSITLPAGRRADASAPEPSPVPTEREPVPRATPKLVDPSLKPTFQ